MVQWKPSLKTTLKIKQKWPNKKTGWGVKGARKRVLIFPKRKYQRKCTRKRSQTKDLFTWKYQKAPEKWSQLSVCFSWKYQRAPEKVVSVRGVFTWKYQRGQKSSLSEGFFFFFTETSKAPEKVVWQIFLKHRNRKRTGTRKKSGLQSGVVSHQGSNCTLMF